MRPLATASSKFPVAKRSSSAKSRKSRESAGWTGVTKSPSWRTTSSATAPLWKRPTQAFEVSSSADCAPRPEESGDSDRMRSCEVAT